jgi:hypothetical protein
MVGGVCYGNEFEGSIVDPNEIFFGVLSRGPEEDTGTLSVVMAFWPKFGMGICRI